MIASPSINWFKAGILALGTDVEIGPVTFSSGLYTKSIIKAYLEFNPSDEKDIREGSWSGYPCLEGRVTLSSYLISKTQQSRKALETRSIRATQASTSP